MEIVVNKIRNISYTNKGVLLLMLGVIFLASGGIFVKLSEVDPISTGVYRIFFAMPMAFIWMKFDTTKQNKIRISQINFRHVLIFLSAGIFLGLDLVFWHISFHYTTVANANLLANLIPFIVLPVSFYLFKENVNRKLIYGLIFSVIGILTLLSGKLSPTVDNFYGDFLAAITAIFYGLYILTISRLRKLYSTSTIMFLSSFGSLLVLIPLALITETNIIPQSIDGIIILFSLALFSHIGGQGFVAIALGYLNASFASVLVLMQPLLAAIYAYFIFAENISFIELTGIFITLYGIYLAKNAQTN